MKPLDPGDVIDAAAKIEKPLSSTTGEDVDLGIDLEEHKLEFQIECLRDELSQLRDNHDLRLSYTGRIFWLVVAWLACVVFCVVFSGFGVWGFKLADSVILASSRPRRSMSWDCSCWWQSGCSRVASRLPSTRSC